MKVLNVRNLSKSFGKARIIKNISFDIDEGQIVGFVGPNGSGKTTTLKMISNLIWPDSGDITICGYNLFKEREKALLNMAGIIENPGLYQDLSGRENLMFIKRLRGVSNGRLDEIIEITGLKDRLDRKVKKYSLGMKQRLALGMCLMTNPRFLILDEPTNGLDPSGTIELRELIVHMARKENVSVFFSSHLLGEVEKISDRVIYIKDGELINHKAYTDNQETIYDITVNDTAKACKVLNNINTISVTPIDRNIISVSLGIEKLDKIINLLVNSGISIFDIEKKKEDAESIYKTIFKGDMTNG